MKHATCDIRVVPLSKALKGIFSSFSGGIRLVFQFALCCCWRAGCRQEIFLKWVQRQFSGKTTESVRGSQIAESYRGSFLLINDRLADFRNRLLVANLSPFCLPSLSPFLITRLGCSWLPLCLPAWFLGFNAFGRRCSLVSESTMVLWVLCLNTFGRICHFVPPHSWENINHKPLLFVLVDACYCISRSINPCLFADLYDLCGTMLSGVYAGVTFVFYWRVGLIPGIAEITLFLTGEHEISQVHLWFLS